MPVVTSEIIESAPESDRRYVRYAFTFHDGSTVKPGRKSIPLGTDINADMVAMIPVVENWAADQEINGAISLATDLYQNPDISAEHQAQAEFDIRVLGRMMLVKDAHALLAAYPMFQVVELRGGANANQRAAYLGINIAVYDLIAARFNNVNGVAWFLADEKDQVWDELSEEIN